MSKRLVIPALLALTVGAAIPVIAQTTQPAEAPATAPAVRFADRPDIQMYLDLKKLEPKLTDADITKYDSDLSGRGDNVLKDLKLPDSEKAKADHVKSSVAAYYKFLRGWHDLHDAEYNPLRKDMKGNAEKIAKVKETLTPIHKAFVDDLNSFLTPEQVDMVKDRMVSSKRMTVIFNGKTKDNPWLNDDQKARLMVICQGVREIALDEGSAADKNYVMDQLVGKVNNFLAAEKKKSTTAPATKPAA